MPQIAANVYDVKCVSCQRKVLAKEEPRYGYICDKCQLCVKCIIGNYCSIHTLPRFRF